MSTLTVYAIDDEVASLILIENFIRLDPRLILIGSESDPIKAKEFLLNTVKLPDILFLDIEMNGFDGFQFAEIFKDKLMIVFSTGFTKFAVDSYTYDAVDYLLKPYSPERFTDAINRCVKEMEQKTQVPNETATEFYVHDTISYDKVRIIKRKVLYLEANGNYTKIFLEDSVCKMPKLSMIKVWALLGYGSFFQVHKQTVVNLDHIVSFNNAIIKLYNGTEIELGPKYRKAFMDRMESKIAC
jgi:DNA-binding LytR/AlgR family response regulator